MIVCIAEKPSVAKDIATILGAKDRKVNKGVGYYEGNGYQVTWTFGHLCTLKEPQDYQPNWKAWSLSALPMIPERFGIKAIEIDNYKAQLSTIEELLKTAEMVINCGDAGQEGELIQRWVLHKCGCKVPIKRLWISSLTDEAIREGFASLKESSEFQSLYEAGLARAIGDWLLGMNATRLFTIKYAPRGQVLSVGRVQTPTLALIVERQKEIENFKPETYWELKTNYRATTFSAEKKKYNKPDEAQADLELITGKDLFITDVSKKAGKDLPPRLFDLTSLQVACNKKFGLSAEETLATIQSLYEKKICTYPRVDTTYLSEDIYPKVGNILKGLDGYSELIAPLLSAKKLRKSKKVFDNKKVTDHHAIIPTGQRAGGLSGREAQVFDLIARHFIAAFYPDCKFSTTTVKAQVEGIKFKASGKEILEEGWRVVFQNNTNNQEDDDEHKEQEESSANLLPTFVLDEHGAHQPELKEKQTQPPKPFTEATLLRAMETAGKFVDDDNLREAMKENGIGRPSTRANIIETLFKRNYITKARRTLKATEIGVNLIDTINYELLKSAELTGQWEYKLRQIERRELSTEDFLDELKAMVHHLVKETMISKAELQARAEQEAKRQEALKQLPLCPKCKKGHIIRGNKVYGCSAYKEGCDYRISFEDYAESFE